MIQDTFFIFSMDKLEKDSKHVARLKSNFFSWLFRNFFEYLVTKSEDISY